VDSSAHAPGKSTRSGLTPRFDINLSTLYTELPVLERASAASDAGFDAVEFWWPFEVAVPADIDVGRFVRAIKDAGVQLVALNFFAGDMPRGDRGLVSWPARSSEFRDSVQVATGIAAELGCRAFNALYGNRIEGIDPAEQDAVAVENLTLAAEAAAGIDAALLLEPLSGAPAYPLRTAADALAVIDRVPRYDNIRLLADLYHLGVNGDDLDAVVTSLVDRIGHVQIADAPGRHEPGTGSLDIYGYLAKLAANGYGGFVGLEYKPSGASADSFAWLPRERRSTAQPHSVAAVSHSHPDGGHS
jgi:hydroxypyruvate isomerase